MISYDFDDDYVLLKKAKHNKKKDCWIKSKCHSDVDNSFFVSHALFSSYYEGNVLFMMFKLIPKYHIKNNSVQEIISSLGDHQHTFCVNVNRLTKTVRFGPQKNLGMLELQMRYQGLGTYLFTKLVSELVVFDCADYQVNDVPLHENDARSRAGRVGRNTFYKGLGFTLHDYDCDDYSNCNCINEWEKIKAGYCVANVVEELNKEFTKKTLTKLEGKHIKALNYRCKGSIELNQV
ncbi:hypothetical protein [Vibrio splendidus]|uniref:hypothetical protein n=1 Tax=Vibrio splendidus TaxID=29497 RepID=UPI00080D8FC0|nr:hypothetical protein [Vibrio splendidus]OCH68591.1 hypothetical protein A6D94_05160 [Vibrio splendidus]